MKSAARRNQPTRFAWKLLTDAGIVHRASKWNRRKHRSGRCPAGHNWCGPDDGCSARAAMKSQLRQELNEGDR